MKNLNTLNRFRQREAEMRLYKTTGDDHNGIFKVFVEKRSFFCIASNGGGWEHVSVSPCNKNRKTCPTWEEMCAIKDMFFEPEEAVVQYHPPKSEYVDNHPYCLHLWRPTDGEIQRPPALYV